MRYLFIISHDATFRPSDKLIGDIGAWVARREREGVRIHGNPLRPATDAVTVRVRKGRVRRSPGPFSSAAEQMCAYELVDCPSLAAAVRLAARHPMAKAATIEVRPVWEALAGERRPAAGMAPKHG